MLTTVNARSLSIRAVLTVAIGFGVVYPLVTSSKSSTSFNGSPRPPVATFNRFLSRKDPAAVNLSSSPIPGELAFSSADYEVTETDGNATIAVRRTGGTDNQVVGKVTLTDVTTNSADYRFAPGQPDAAFNPGGGADSDVNVVAVQPDGKIVIGGFFTAYNGDSAVSARIMRLNADGTRDTTFNPGRTGANNQVMAVALQPDGKIVVGGKFTSYNGDAAASDYIMRLNADGTRDTAFNSGGAGPDDWVFEVAVQSDGKIVIGGNFNLYNGNSTSRKVMRLNADGTHDTTFNAGGFGLNGTPSGGIVVQPDGKIVVAGFFTSYNGDDTASDAIMRLNPDGTYDSSFNPGGEGVNNSVEAVAMQPDGKILLGGYFTGYNGDAAASDKIMRLNADGTLDTTFNPGGTGADDTVWAVAVQPDGKIVIGGYLTSYNGDATASDGIMRLNADGTYDTTFNPGGTGLDYWVWALAMLPNGKIVLGGYFTSYNGDAAVSDCITRLDGDLFVTWADGDATDRIIQFPIVNDGISEGDETLTPTLDVISGSATLGSPNQSTLTIHDPPTPPVLSNVSVTSPVNENDSVTLSGNISDPNAGDTFSLTVDWGDGSSPQTFGYAAGTTSFNETHQYTDDNPIGTASDNYTINLTLSDGSGSDTDSATVTVNNAAPILSNISASPANIPVGGTTTLIGTVSDAGIQDTHQIVINWGDSSSSTILDLAAGMTTFSANHQYNVAGDFNVVVTATDDDTGSTTGGTSVTATTDNHAPTAVNDAYDVNEDTPLSITAPGVIGNDSDPENDLLNPLLVAGPTHAASFGFFADGSFSYIPAANFNGVDSFIYKVSDGQLNSNIATVTLTVNPVNDAPTIIGATIIRQQGVPASSDIAVISDIDNAAGSLIVMATNLPTGISVTGINNTNGAITATVSVGCVAIGEHSVGLQVSDGNLTATADLTVNVATGPDADGDGLSDVCDGCPTRPRPEKITFVSNRDGNPEIYVMNANGTNQTRLTNNPADDRANSFPGRLKDCFCFHARW